MVQYTLWALPSLAATVICVAMVPHVWPRRATPGAVPVIVLLLATSWWSLLETIGTSLTTLDGKMLLAVMQYPGIVAVPVAWFSFALLYTGLRSWYRRVLPALLLVPTTSVVLAFTNDSHFLLWSDIRRVEREGFVGLVLDHGPWFSVAVGHAYALVAGATVVLLWRILQSTGRRRLVASVIGAPLLVCLANVYYLSPWNPSPWLDLTPLSFALAAALFSWGVFRQRLLDIVPVARKAVIEAITEGVIVLDAQRRVQDLNPAARAMLGAPSDDARGRPMSELVNAGALSAMLGGAEGQGANVVLEGSGSARVYHVTVSELPEDNGDSSGMILLLRDTTENVRAEERLRDAMGALEKANLDLTRLANTDSLTGLANRRYFLEQLEIELDRARRYQRPLSLLLVDLDFFKRVNDTFGHAMGDHVLETAGEAIQSAKRTMDISGRLGGEEFALILPETDEAGATAVAERVRSAMRSHTHWTDENGEYFVTASVGVAVAGPGPTETEEVLRAADHALYQAKSEGRDRVCVAMQLA